MKKIFPTLEDDWGIYIPEVKYLSPEPLVDYDTLALIDYNNVHFVGDALSARGITVSGAQGNYVAEWILQCMEDELSWEDNPDVQDFLEHADKPGSWSEEDNKIHTVGGLTNDKEKSFIKFQNKINK